MSKYRVLVADSNEFVASFDRFYAEKYAKQLMKTTGKETYVIEVISTYSPVIDSYEAAADYLGENAKNHQKALTALVNLIVIAEAWNRQDGFAPDFTSTNQYKWFPFFKYDNKAAGFVCAGADDTAVYAYAAFGSRLCFSTSERAIQFGTQFINLWNDFLLFR